MFSDALGFLLKVIYDLVSNYGLAIIIFTLLVKVALLPLTLAQTKSMKAMQDIQPKIKDIQEKYKNDKEKMNQKIMELYQEKKINPMSGCLPILVQFPILIGLFNALRDPVAHVFKSQAAYDAVGKTFLWIPNLTDPDKIILPILAGVTTYISSAMITPKESRKEPAQMVMLYFMPIMIFIWSRSFPAGLALYWAVSNLFQIFQQVFIIKPAKHKED